MRSRRVLVVPKSTAVGDLPYEGVVVVGSGGRIVICVDDYLDADSIASSFGPNDGFRRQLNEAMIEAWPDGGDPS